MDSELYDSMVTTLAELVAAGFEVRDLINIAGLPSGVSERLGGVLITLDLAVEVLDNGTKSQPKGTRSVTKGPRSSHHLGEFMR